MTAEAIAVEPDERLNRICQPRDWRRHDGACR